MADRQGEETVRVEEVAPAENIPDIVKVVRSLSDSAQRRSLVWRAVIVLLIAASIPVVLDIPSAVGKMFALGVRATIAEDAPDWGREALVFPAIITGLTVAIYVLQIVVWFVAALLSLVVRQFSDETRKFVRRAARLLVVAAVVAVAVRLVYRGGREGYQTALKHPPSRIADADQKTIAETREAAARQGQAIKKFSATADILLKDLDSTAIKVAETKHEIAQTMVLFDRQLEATQAAQANLAKLAEQQLDIQSRAQELELILNGKRPVTQEDLDRSGRDALWQGGLIGVLASLVAAYLFNQLGRLEAIIVRRKRLASGSDSPPPPDLNRPNA